MTTQKEALEAWHRLYNEWCLHSYPDRLKNATDMANIRRFIENAAPSIQAIKTEWVNCPICKEPDMRMSTVTEEGDVLINCVNHGCPSNIKDWKPSTPATSDAEKITDNIINMFGEQFHDDPPHEFLEKVKSIDFDTCLVVGQEPDGKLFFGGNTGDMEHNLWLLMRALWHLQRLEGSLS